jgi:general secretion pathway protein J
MIRIDRVKPNGFTLLEVLVAIGMFAILGVLAYGGLNTVLTAQTHSKQEAERLAALQLSMRYLQRDIEQFVDRPVRDKFGDLKPSLMVSEQSTLELTHAGWRNPAGLLRSQLQRVSYGLDDESTLIRMISPILDGADEDKLIRTSLLENVEELEIRVLDEQGNWQKEWPPLNEAQKTPGETMQPMALEITLTANPWGKIRRLIALLR